jgi:hypothetical protein
MRRKDLMDAPHERFYSKILRSFSTVDGAAAVDRPTCCAAGEYGPLVPYHAEDEPPVLCWDCHGYLVGPPGRRLCHCPQPGAVSPAEAERLRALETMRDALAETYRRRWFRVLMPLLGCAEDEARAAGTGCGPPHARALHVGWRNGVCVDAGECQ